MITAKEALDIFKKTWVLTNWMKAALRTANIINWMWPTTQSKIISYILEKLKTFLFKWKQWTFEADSDYHDVWYYLWVTEEDRAVADRWYFKRLINDILKMDLPVHKEIYYVSLAYIAYRLVRKYWKAHFNYNYKEDENTENL